MSMGSWLKALCLALLVVIVIDTGFIIRMDSLSRDASFMLAAMTAVAGLAPIVFAIYLMRATRNDR